MKIDLEDQTIINYEKLVDISVNLVTDLGSTTIATSEFLKLKKAQYLTYKNLREKVLRFMSTIKL